MWDGSALICSCSPNLFLFAKRQEKGKFVWPPIIEGAVQQSAL
jgi:hypothetical protein